MRLELAAEGIGIRRPGRSQASLVGIPALLAAVAVLGALFALLPSTAPRCPGGAASVVLDPGHGGDDTGATNATSGLVERDLVLRIARETAARLGAEGYRVALTRSDDQTGLGNSPRGRIANACHAFAYVSIHLNSFDQPEPNYAKTLWGLEAKDRAFAETMQAALVARLRPGSELGDSGVEEFENGGLLTARMPAVLVEPVFLSNPAEAGRLANPDGRRLTQIAEAIAEGVDAWLRSESIRPASWVGPGDRMAMRSTDPLRAPPRGSPAAVVAAAVAAGAERPDDVRSYVEEVYRLAPLAGLDPAIVVAQSALETGWWRSSAWVNHLNPAGLGITGSDVASPSWDTGVDAARAQLVHLSLYAAGPIATDSPLAPYVGLDPRYEAALAAGRAGSARTLADLAGRWATDREYAEKIAGTGSTLFGS